MKTLTLASAAAGLILISAPSLAQTTPPPPTPTVSVNVPTRDIGSRLPGGTGATNMADYAQGEIHRQNMSARARTAVQNTSPGRLSRAERVAELINAGDCAGAHALAIQENDRRLAHRVAEVCEIEE